MSAQAAKPTTNGEKATLQTTKDMLSKLAQLAMAPHYRVFLKTTYRPIKRIADSTTAELTREHILEWCKRKTNEARYVQVAGAVMFASVLSCLGWDAVTDTHWLVIASFYACILLSLASIFSAAQQSLVLPDLETLRRYSAEQIELLRLSLLNKAGDKPSAMMLFVWQCPIMLLGYSVAWFVIGLCTVVIYPVALNARWDDSAKVATLFLVVLTVIAISAAATTEMVYRFRV